MLGFDLGQTLMLPSVDNPRGFWENQKLVEVHDKLLSSFDKDWSTIASLEGKWMDDARASEAVEEILDVLQSDFRPKESWLVKDPRLCMLYPIWKRVGETLNRPVKLVTIIRSPEATSRSMQIRNNLKPEDADIIALSYFQVMNENLNKDIGKIFVYENLIQISGREILGHIRDALGMKSIKSNHNLASQIERLIIDTSGKEIEKTRIHQTYIDIVKDAPVVTGKVLDALVKALVDEPTRKRLKKVSNRKTLLDVSQQRVSLTKGELDKYQMIEQKFDGLRDLVHSQIEEIRVLKHEKGETIAALKDELGRLTGGIADRDNLLAESKSKISGLQNLLDSKILEFSNERKRLTEQQKALEKSLKSSKSQLAIKKKALVKTEEELQSSQEELKASKERMKAKIRRTEKKLETQLAEMTLAKEMQDASIELDAARSKMVESTLNTRIGEIERRLSYYEKSPIRAGLKRVSFSTLRAIRRCLPLPEAIKLKIARKLTGVAVGLQPPNILSQFPEPNNFADVTQLDFAFTEYRDPAISIVVPVYNEISQTIACLRSIYLQDVSVDYEVILADDKSPDPSHAILKEIPGLRYFRNQANLHFLRNCNTNAVHARGDYIVFLNNDTVVKPGWLQNLLDTFLENDSVGVVGSKLIYPSGELQEAGGILWQDASGWNWGKGQDASHPLYNFVREVDFVSGASLMIPTMLWRQIGGFNEGLEKAYYEDADLCFRVRSMGYKVLYQPESEVVHIEGLSSGTDLTQGAKQYQVVNQEIFKETWATVLSGHLPNATTPYLASDRAVKGHILYIDATTPEPDKDAGSVNSVYSMRLLIEAGYRVHFIPGSNFAYWGEYTKALQKLGVECVYYPFYSNIKSYLDERGDMFEHVIVSRAESAELMLPTVKKMCPNAKIIYNTVDLHFMRMEREAEILKDASIKIAAKKMRITELGFIEECDATIVLSEVERSLLSKQKSIKDKLWTIPLIRPDARRLVEFETSEDIVFIGGYKHPPNVDAVEWLVKEIWPEMRKRLPGVKLRICGSSMPPHFKDFAAEDVLIKGFIPDLDGLLAKTRLTIAPLRYGAGLKGKVASSIGAGVPCIGTDVAFEGMAEKGLSDIRFLATTPESFAKIAETLYFDKEKWTNVSLAGVEYHNANYAYRNVSEVYQQMLDSLV